MVTIYDARAAAPFQLQQRDPRTVLICDPLDGAAAGPVRVLAELTRRRRTRSTRAHEYVRQASRGRPYNPQTAEDVWEIRVADGIIGRHEELHRAAAQTARWLTAHPRRPLRR